jgi:hypothetical protein
MSSSARLQAGRGGPVPGAPPAAGSGWPAGRIVAAVSGAILAPAAAGIMICGLGLLWAVSAFSQHGWLTSGPVTYTTSGRALVSQQVRLGSGDWAWAGPALAGRVRIRVTTSGGRPVFVGIARAPAAARYLAGAAYTAVTSITSPGGDLVTHLGTAIPPAPAAAGIWAARTQGRGTQALTWRPRPGSWVVVAMNADSSAGLTVRADAGAEHSVLPQVAAGLIGTGALLASGGVGLIIAANRRAARGRPASGRPARLRTRR